MSQRPKKKRKRGKQAFAPGNEQSQQDKNAQRAKVLGEEGNFTKSLQALVSNGLADYSRESLAEMKAKHPFSPPPTVPDTDVRQMYFSPTQILEAVKSFQKGSAAGPSGQG